MSSKCESLILEHLRTIEGERIPINYCYANIRKNPFSVADALGDIRSDTTCLHLNAVTEQYLLEKVRENSMFEDIDHAEKDFSQSLSKLEDANYYMRRFKKVKCEHYINGNLESKGVMEVECIYLTYKGSNYFDYIIQEIKAKFHTSITVLIALGALVISIINSYFLYFK